VPTEAAVTDAPVARDARAEAQAMLGPGLFARVLEPSPPAVVEPPWLADDPARTPAPPGTRVVAPVATGDLTWSELAATVPALGAWCADRWLGAFRRLEPLPPALAVERADLHRLAFHVMSSARERANGKIALRYTHRGWGTPFFGEDVQVRVEGTRLVVQAGAEVRFAPITTLDAAAKLAGVEYEPAKAERFDVPAPIPGDRALAVSEETVDALTDWYGFATSVLEELRLLGGEEDDAGRVQIWAEHFDAAVDMGDSELGRRASFGASPGDGDHAEPYLYVGPWEREGLDGPYWNDAAFGGASLPYRDLLAADDQRAAALDFLVRGLRLLGAR
jgi:hypothetical protein